MEFTDIPNSLSKREANRLIKYCPNSSQDIKKVAQTHYNVLKSLGSLGK